MLITTKTQPKGVLTLDQINYTPKSKKGQHLTYIDRQNIEMWIKDGHKPEEIGRLLGGRSKRTIYREIANGRVKLLNSDLTERIEYSADVAQKKHNYNATAKGPSLKIGKNYRLVQFIEDKIIKEKFSPSAALEEAKKEGYEVNICFKTLYNYIDEGVFPHLTNKDLPVKKKGKKHKYNHVRKALHCKGKSIEERPLEAEERKVFGHWELDTVVGKQRTKAVLMVMTERSTGMEIIRKIKSKSEECIVRELDRLERKLGSKNFRENFKTITCDNGCENLDFKGMEQSVLTNGKRMQVFYAHPYSAWERGSNENFNKLVRRFIPKGADITKYSKKYIAYIQHWINHYPRKKLNWKSSSELSFYTNSFA